MIARRIAYSILEMGIVNITPASKNDLISFKPIPTKARWNDFNTR